MIVSRWPSFEDDEIAAVSEVLRSGRVNALQHGERCAAFERAFVEITDVPHAIAVANGTLALELGLRALGIGPGDEVVVTPRSFVASASCVVTCSATPVFADIDADSQNLTVATVEAVIGPRTKAVIAVHLAGLASGLDALAELCRERGLLLIEDCAQALGATWRGAPAGSFGDAAAFSFCTDKIVSTGGEGGMLLLSDAAAYERAWSYKDHGKDRAKLLEPAAPGFRWLHDGFGSNWRLTEMQAAIGLRQVAKLERWLARRRANAAALGEALAALPGLRLTPPPPEAGHAYYKYYAFVRPERLRPGWDRDRIMVETAASGVPCFSGSCSEIYRERAFAAAGLVPPEPLPVARELGETSLMFLVDHTLDGVDMARVGEAAARVMARATV